MGADFQNNFAYIDFGIAYRFFFEFGSAFLATNWGPDKKVIQK